MHPESPDAERWRSSNSERALIESADNVYYINDGIYGSFNAIIFDNKVFIVHYLKSEWGKQER